ncbi:MAG: NAD(P)-binding protein [Methylococcaceae bacterium]|nr:NAD(P)-binding protein [Methylococcaceae bacterium]
MKIAVIGGGAAGMATAYLLDKQHEISVFEQQPILGGNIRTLNKNVTGVALDPNVILDNGVIEFQRENFPNFHRLMQALNVPIERGRTSSELFLSDGHTFKSGAGILHDCQGISERLKEIRKIMPIMGGYLNFLLKTRKVKPGDLYDKPMSDFLNQGVHSIWLKMLLMYAYSMPFNTIDNFPAEIAIPLLQQSDMFTQWDRIVGGVYTYIEKILQQFSGHIHLSVDIKAISRQPNGIIITMQDGERLHFDKVVFAVTPEQVLGLLADASEDERRRFDAWKPNEITTIIHTDVSFYKHFGVSYFSEFDVFQNNAQGDCGYNAYLNRLYGIDAKRYGHYSLAYNLSKQINPTKVVHLQKHQTPYYSVAAVRYRHEVIATNGENHTYHAGAYLGNGLHEGAISSAYAVAGLLA